MVYGLFFWSFVAPVPDTLRFLFVVVAIAGAIYGGALTLASFPPEQSEIIKPLPHEKLRTQ
jgi:hypothetical protein